MLLFSLLLFRFVLLLLLLLLNIRNFEWGGERILLYIIIIIIIIKNNNYDDKIKKNSSPTFVYSILGCFCLLEYIWGDYFKARRALYELKFLGDNDEVKWFIAYLLSVFVCVFFFFVCSVSGFQFHVCMAIPRQFFGSH